MRTTSIREEYLIPGRNGLETCVILSENGLFPGKLMEQVTVKEVLRRFNESGVRYCLVGGLAVAHHAVPRQTQDVDIMVLPEDLPLVQRLLQGYELRGTAVVMIFQIGETRFDIIPANLRAKRSAVLAAMEDEIDDTPVKVVNLRDLILLKMWAAPDRPEQRKRRQDETDVVGLIELNPDKVSAEDISYICRSLLALAYTPEDMNKYRAQIEWLNGELEKLGLPDLRFQLP
jgi:predicted nucleotidyltransferase